MAVLVKIVSEGYELKGCKITVFAQKEPERAARYYERPSIMWMIADEGKLPDIMENFERVNLASEVPLYVFKSDGVRIFRRGPIFIDFRPRILYLFYERYLTGKKLRYT